MEFEVREELRLTLDVSEFDLYREEEDPRVSVDEEPRLIVDVSGRSLSPK